MKRWPFFPVFLFALLISGIAHSGFSEGNDSKEQRVLSLTKDFGGSQECGAAIIRELRFRESPALKAEEDKIERETARTLTATNPLATTTNSPPPDTSPTLTLWVPVVVHILHENGPVRQRRPHHDNNIKQALCKFRRFS